MHNPLPRQAPSPVPQAHTEVLSRLASVRHALRLVDPHGGGPAPDPETDDAIAAAWDSADEIKRRRFDRKTGELVGATAAGVDALMKEDQPNAEASRALVEQIRRELRQVTGIILD